MSAMGKPGYHKTQAGWLPLAWTANNLSDLVAVVYGKSPSELKKLEAGFPIFGTGGVVGYTDTPLSQGPSVILGRKGTIDKVQLSVGPFWAIDTTFYTTSRRSFDWKWLYYVMSSFDLRKLNEASGVPSLSRASLEALVISTPPPLEQEKIAATLTAVDDKLDVLARQIDATQTLKRGLMQTLFSRNVGGGSDEAWFVVPLCEVAEVRTGVAKGKKGLKEPVELPYLRVANVQDGYFDLSEVKTIAVEVSQVERYALRSGDVLMTEGGDFDKLGRGDVWEGEISPCLHQNHVFAVRPDPEKLNSYFLAALAASDYGKQYFLSCAKRTTNLASINSSQLKAFPVLLPPLEIQREISEVVAAANAKVAVLESRQAALQSLKRGLMQKLLTGEWRVKLDADEAVAA
ncbi:restriction endonuclease subunit S [Burkholderia ambifaria]|uniref:restriction endonuclease subunit S n=1 Tax=Burkholderia ambifaria TaxID=152480 RepID=UPI001E495B7F|nr:restriction endonuclease subunit S [Burkholderia ambifaria]UEP34728.1 restriction endonuclease subunit S [Burkholderia ambifaria]